MCGHVGLAGKMTYRDENTMKRLLMFDYFRGPDSTGLAAVRNDGEIKLAKIASNPVNLFDTTRYKAVSSAATSAAFIGHNRAATKGAVNDVNAHPYHHDHIVGAHNGTLTQASWDDLCKVIGEKTGTDSDAIFACIAKIGIEETAKLLQGAWALVWVDTNEGTLNFLRNKERPFWYAYTKSFDLILWASEAWMLRAALSSTPEKDKYEAFIDKDNYSFFQTTENWHYRYSLADLKKGFVDRPKPRVKELKGKEPAPVVTHTTGYGNFPSRTYTGGQGAGSTISKTTTTPAIKRLTTTPADPLGGYISENEFTTQYAKNGCSFCMRSIGFRDKGVVIFEKEGLAIGSCCSGRTVSRIYASPSKYDAFVKLAEPLLKLTPPSQAS